MQKENKIKRFHKVWGAIAICINATISGLSIYKNMLGSEEFGLLLSYLGAIVFFIVSEICEVGEGILSAIGKRNLIKEYIILGLISCAILVITWIKASILYAFFVLIAMVIEALVSIFVFVEFPIKPPPPKSYMDDDKE